MSKEWDELWKDYEEYKKDYEKYKKEIMDPEKFIDLDRWKKADPYDYGKPWKNDYDEVDKKEERRKIKEVTEEINRIIKEAENSKIAQKKRVLQTEIVEKLHKLFDRILGDGSTARSSETLEDSEFVGYCRGIVEEGGKLTREQFERLNEMWKKYK